MDYTDGAQYTIYIFVFTYFIELRFNFGREKQFESIYVLF